MTMSQPGPEADPAGRISRSNLHEQVVTRLRDMIIEGRLEPGQRIHEGQIGEALGVSRTPLREALKFLASEGLVELVPGRGALVRRLDRRDVREMLDVLTALETLAARLFCAKATEADIASLRALHQEMMQFYRARRRLDYYKCNQDIHSTLVRLSGNCFLSATHQAIQSRLKRIRFIGHEGEANWQAAILEHEEMMAAIESRDADRLAEVVTRHLNGAWDRVQDAI
jgi:DNA-binding GntR family transcriptional regulator